MFCNACNTSSTDAWPASFYEAVGASASVLEMQGCLQKRVMKLICRERVHVKRQVGNSRLEQAAAA